MAEELHWRRSVPNSGTTPAQDQDTVSAANVILHFAGDTDT